MNDINKHCDDNLGGVYLLRFIPKTDVSSIALPIKGRVCEPVVLNAGACWYEFYGTEGTKNLKEDQQPSEHGDFFKLKLSGSTPKIRTSISDTLNEMKDKEFIIDCIDNNGHRRLLGTINEPLRFQFTSDTGNSAPNKNAYTFEFYGDVSKSPPTYYI
jgi:hypothetical protein